MNTNLQDPRERRLMSLRIEEVQRLRGPARLRVARGLVWLTVDGDPDDHMLQPGDRFELGRGDEALVQALRSTARVEIVRRTTHPWWDAAAQMFSALQRRLAGALQ